PCDPHATPMPLAGPVQQKSRNLIPAFLPHSTLRTTLKLHLMPRRRFEPVSHTWSDYCVFASSTEITYQKRCPPHVTSCGDTVQPGNRGLKSRFRPAPCPLRPDPRSRWQSSAGVPACELTGRPA